MLSYFQSGPLKAPPIVFLHGFLGCKEDWEAVVSKLEDSFCCYCFDLPGHGDSDFQLNLLESISSAISSLTLDKPVLVGYSMGGRMALQLEKAYPELCDQLLLFSAHPGLMNLNERESRWKKDAEWIQILSTHSIDEFLTRWYDEAIFAPLKKKREVFSAILDRRKKCDPNHLAAVLRMTSLAHQPFLHPPLSKTLLVYGEEDLKFEALYHTLLPTIEKRKIRFSGHAVHLENPGGCADAIRDYLIQRR